MHGVLDVFFMSKKILVKHADEYTNLNAPFLKHIWDRYFDVELFDVDKTYNPTVHVLWVSVLNKIPWYQTAHDQGVPLIIENLWEADITLRTEIKNNCMILRCLNWIWYSESLWYRSLGYDTYRYCRSKEHSFLMLMHLKKPHRDRIVNKLSSVLDRALYSYVGAGIAIAGDGNSNNGNWQRYLNPAWYDSTAFSVVVESAISQPTFISEKIFKPIAYYHPFVVWGSAYSLQYLHEQGFETFGHVIDESYDTELDHKKRLQMVCDITCNLSANYATIFDDTRTKEILEHNHNRFFADDIEQRFEQEVIGDILKFIQQ
jgi:hypothetical protein